MTISKNVLLRFRQLFTAGICSVISVLLSSVPAQAAEIVSTPVETTPAPLQLSLQEAILLAVRQNPNVQSAQLGRVTSKFALRVAQWGFEPQYAFTAGTTRTTSVVSRGPQQTTTSSTISPSATLKTVIGTQVTLASTNPIAAHYNPGLALTVAQPLLRGFGRAVVEAALHDAEDSDRINKLNLQDTVQTTITNVINAYLDVVSAQNTLEIDKQALDRAMTSVKQTELFIKAGRKAGNELITVQADVAKARATLETDTNNTETTVYALLTAIGLDPNTPVIFTDVDIPALLRKYEIPDKQQSVDLVLANDIAYQTSQITYEGVTKRSLVIAEDNTRWALNVTDTQTIGNGSGGGFNAGTNSLVNGSNKNNTLAVNLTVPIDDLNLKQAVVDAKISLEQADLALKQLRWSKITTAITQRNQILSTQRSLQFAEDAERLQKQTYDLTFQKYSHGLIDSLLLQQVQQNLIASEQAVVSARIGYLQALATYDQALGRTLQTWDIKMRFD